MPPLKTIWENDAVRNVFDRVRGENNERVERGLIAERFRDVCADDVEILRAAQEVLWQRWVDDVLAPLSPVWRDGAVAPVDEGGDTGMVHDTVDGVIMTLPIDVRCPEDVPCPTDLTIRLVPHPDERQERWRSMIEVIKVEREFWKDIQFGKVGVILHSGDIQPTTPREIALGRFVDSYHVPHTDVSSSRYFIAHEDFIAATQKARASLLADASTLSVHFSLGGDGIPSLESPAERLARNYWQELEGDVVSRVHHELDYNDRRRLRLGLYSSEDLAEYVEQELEVILKQEQTMIDAMNFIITCICQSDFYKRNARSVTPQDSSDVPNSVQDRALTPQDAQDSPRPPARVVTRPSSIDF
ncbi:MAG: hypothetical protein WBB39_05230 [Candidatus Saccharimonadales bacterium]